MSHIDGHVEKPPQSAGIIVLKDAQGKIVARLPFIPPSAPWLINGAIVKNMKVGFHPLTLEQDAKGNPTKIIDIDVVRQQDHNNAENKMRSKLGLDPTLTLENFYHIDRGNGKKQMEVELNKGEFNDEQKDVIQKTLSYLGTPDFDFYYVDKDVADSSNARAKVISIMKA